MSESKPILSVRDIYCGYQGTEILHGISFDVFPNEKLCILGPNGCGKTTLLRAVNRLLPFKGEISACGRPVGRISRKAMARTMVYMSQVNAVYFPYTVYETVMMGRYSHSKGIFAGAGAEDIRIAEESLMRTNTWDLKDKLLTQLSGGQFQRVLLARVFAQSPEIILLDEPTNHLDLKYQIELMDYLGEWVSHGNRCVVSVLHDLNLALSFSDHILLMENGNCVYHAPAKEFPLEKINQVYGMDICQYMQKALGFWEKGNQ